ncbi:MAG: DUF4199 domain-containing protein [Saprospiraceae bacterium]|nr:DUF4199 domain-containing protein [Saprospiraceae bacterium]
MKKIVWTYGLIAGGITAVALIAGMVLMAGPDGKMDMDSNMVFGYTAMIVALSLIFFGIRSYRDKYLDGNISFGKAFKIGLLITVVASVMYVLTWMAYYHTTDIGEQFGPQYAEHLAEKMRASGTPEQEIIAKMKEQEDFMKLYDSNPLVMFGVTLMEIFPVGLVISLISSFFLRHKAVRE